jgi:hypothetical protein
MELVCCYFNKDADARPDSDLLSIRNSCLLPSEVQCRVSNSIYLIVSPSREATKISATQGIPNTL